MRIVRKYKTDWKNEKRSFFHFQGKILRVLYVNKKIYTCILIIKKRVLLLYKKGENCSNKDIVEKDIN